jgi:hypothetical protein
MTRRLTIFTTAAFTCLCTLVALFTPLIGSVVVNEFMYDPSVDLGDDDDYEWIELYNHEGDDVVINGWTVNGVVLQGEIKGHDFFLIARQDTSDPDNDGDFFSIQYNAEHGYDIYCDVFDAEGQSLGLENQYGQIVLKDAEGSVVETFVYDDSMGGNGDGSSLERIVTFRPPAPLNWKGSTPPEDYGTPGMENSQGGVFIDVTLIPEEVHHGDEVEIVLLLRNNYPQMLFLRTWSEVIFPDEQRMNHIGSTPVILPPLWEIELSFHVTVPSFIPVGKYLYRGILGKNSDSLVPEAEEFSVNPSPLH